MILLRGIKTNGFVAGFVACLIALSFLTTLPSALVAAADSGTAGQGIQISPVLVDLNAEKGKTYNLKLTVTNVTAGTLQLKAEVNDFRAKKDESGNPEFFLDKNEDSSTFSSRKWISTINGLTLKSKESRTIGFSVDVPENAEPGGHYSVIRFIGLPPDLSNNNVAVNISVGVLILSRVEGNLSEDLKLLDFFITKNNKKQVVVEGTPFTIKTRVQNNGNVHVKPIGHVTIKNFFGKTVATMNYGDKDKNVLPASIRQFEQTISNKRLFGRYTMNIEAAYGTTGKVLTGQASFWVIPYKLILILMALLLVGVVLLRRGVKLYNARILKKAGHNHPKGR